MALALPPSARRAPLALALALALAPPAASAATSTRSVPSAFAGAGHNASFDGRLYLAHTGSGWDAFTLRPEGATYASDGLPDAGGPLWSAPFNLLVGEPNGENALAICEADPARAPFACDAAGAPSAAGPFACYDLWIIDSDQGYSVSSGGQTFRRRHLLLRVAEPKTATAHPVAAAWGPLEPLAIAGGGGLHGIEPTVTRDGKLMIWNGSLDNGDSQETMVYAVNAAPCGAGGWTAPRPLSHMAQDPLVNTKYRIAARQLRAADGTPFADGAAVPGAYPWLFPDGDAVIFSAAMMACRGPDDPSGCGRRRNATSVLGYPTNWGVAHIDGGINPSTTDTVRLFFSSPGPTAFSQLPATHGQDVWPFFGTNTANYVEISFDDGLDGKYAGLWHMNESITAAGGLDPGRSPDVSGYFNTAVAHGGVTFPAANNGVLGKAAVLANGWLEVADAPSLSPVNGVTLEVTLRPAGDPDCGPGDDRRVLLRKGAAYELVLEDTRRVRASVRVAGGATYSLASPAGIAADGATWTRVTAEYDAASGRMQLRIDGSVVAEQAFAPAPLEAAAAPLTIGGAGPGPACGAGQGFAGALDEVSVSRIARHLDGATPPDPPGDAPDGGVDPNPPGPGGGGCCGAGRGAPGPGGPLLLGLAVGAALRRRRMRGAGR